ncbi:hypothetical protein ACPA9J_02645 [Pseudomonas aeruginosa]
MIESQDRLNKLLLEKETTEVLNVKKADLGATFIKIGSNNRRLKIWNKGNRPRATCLCRFPDGNDCLVQSDIDSKFPLETLDTLQSVELIASISLDSKSKHPIKLTWSDDFSDHNEKVVYPDDLNRMPAQGHCLGTRAGPSGQSRPNHRCSFFSRVANDPSSTPNSR